MDKSNIDGPNLYAKYIAFILKNYAETPVNNNSAIDYYVTGGAGNWGNELFHYCTIETLKCITEEKRLRFSDIRFLNDTTEFMDVLPLLKRVITDQRNIMDKELYNILTDGHIFNKLNDYFQCYSFYFMKEDKGLHIDAINLISRIYTCSFSMQGDLLPMWNYYAYSADGVSINFKELKRHMKAKGNVKLIWGKVWYHEKDKRQCIEELLKDICELFSLIPDEKRRRNMVQTVMITAINNMRIFMKNENYSTEDEYRAVLIVPEENVKNNLLPGGYKKGHFNRGNVIIPYIDIPFDPESISNIIVGSGTKGDFSMIKLGLEDWLMQQNLNCVSIYPSNIPIRKY